MNCKCKCAIRFDFVVTTRRCEHTKAVNGQLKSSQEDYVINNKMARVNMSLMKLTRNEKFYFCAATFVSKATTNLSSHLNVAVAVSVLALLRRP